MLRIKAICALALGVLVSGAVTAAAASAAEAGWMVEGRLLAAGERESVAEETMKVSATYKLVSGTTIIECTTLKVKGGYIEGINKNGATSLVFTGCASGSANCTLSSTTIATVPVLAEATLDPPNPLASVIRFKPETGTTFTTFRFEGEKCALVGAKPISGTQAVLAPTGADERTLQTVTAIELTPGELKEASANASLTGSSGLTLESGKNWSFL